MNFYPFIYIYTHMFIYYIVPAGVVSSDYQLSFNSMSVSFDLQIQECSWIYNTVKEQEIIKLLIASKWHDK